MVLVDDSGASIGVADKIAVHTHDTALHLAFSCHVYNTAGQILVTRRALSKLTWPGVWTNSFCGHPAPGETQESAIARRGLYELGLTLTDLEVVIPDFRYRAVDASGIVENEICPVYRAITSEEPTPNPDEVAEFQWVDPQDLRDSAAAAPYAFSPWLGWQLSRWPN